MIESMKGMMQQAQISGVGGQVAGSVLEEIGESGQLLM